MRSLFLIALVALEASAIACSDSASVAPPPTSESDLVGGVSGSDPRLDAVGAIVLMDASEQPNVSCTGTLIAPRLVLTAKSCAVGADGTTILDTLPITFNMGASIATSKHTIAFASVDVCKDPDVGGTTGRGCNVAIYHLSESIHDIAPLPLGRLLTVRDLDHRFTTVGTGATTWPPPSWTFGTRTSGSTTLRALTGSPMIAMFPTLNDYAVARAKLPGHAPSPDEIAQEYARELLPGTEAWLGGAPGDAQLCLADPGAPLLDQSPDGTLTVYGVAGMGSCGPFGTSFTMINDAVKALVAKKRVDPCGDETSAGRCDGDVAVRCTKVEEGTRRIARSDCRGVLQHCVAPSATNAQVSCAD